MLNPDQTEALEKLHEFLASGEDYFLLSGYAGTGKTFLLKEFLSQVRGKVALTAPTNKAVRVLRESFEGGDNKPYFCTIYSLLGLQFKPNGEVKELRAPEQPVKLSSYAFVVIDEASMLGKNVLGYIYKAAQSHGLKFIFLGDSAQLPPVGENQSPIWALPHAVSLTKIMRHDNQILKFVTAVREKIGHPAPTCAIASDNDASGGVFVLKNTLQMSEELTRFTEGGYFSNARNTTAKIIAWRNATVNKYNATIRRILFPEEWEMPWLPGDRVILTSPAKDLENNPIAHTDDEGIIERIEVAEHPIYDGITVYNLSVMSDEGKMMGLRVLHEASKNQFLIHKENLKQRATRNPAQWGDFWKFIDAFHCVRHAYAITAHRAQGSTYDAAFVDYRDILQNYNRREAYQCLYVACSRPKSRLFLI